MICVILLCLFLLVGCQPTETPDVDITVNDNENIETEIEQEEQEYVEDYIGTMVDEKYYIRAKELSDKYDVRILIADLCSTEFTDHSADLLLNETEIELSLSTIDYVMSRYPEGFFSQLKFDTHQLIEVHVLGELRKEVGVSGAFVTADYSHKLVMAVDGRGDMPGETINGILEELLYHEISHLIDKKLDFVALYQDDPVYSEAGWLALNPEGFEYTNSYEGILDKKYFDYFVNDYACTNSTEDRATIMEFVMDGDEYPFIEREGLANKLQYYCEGIRAGFDTTGWPEKLPWEIL